VYKFRAEARNQEGYSFLSTEVAILAAQVPAQPAPPVTSFENDNIIVSWTAPDNGGSEILAYSVVLRKADMSFSAELTNCDGADASKVAAMQCTVPALVLHESPFSLAWGDPVYAKVTATNVKGDSLESAEGNGGNIVTVPFAPVNLAEVYEQRSPTEIGLAWMDGADDGGLPVLDYQVNFAVEGQTHIVY